MKTRRPQDLTLRNANASKARDAKLLARIVRLEKAVSWLYHGRKHP